MWDRRNGRPWAIVEAKRTSREALEGKRQAADYADRICAAHHFEPFIFLTMGKKYFFGLESSIQYERSVAFLQKMIWRVWPFSVNIEKI